jgi:hypothetical protein
MGIRGLSEVNFDTTLGSVSVGTSTGFLHYLLLTATQETLGQWLVQIETDEARGLELPTDRRGRERLHELRDLRRSLKIDERFIQITRAVRRLPPGRERQAVLQEFWVEIYRDHPTEAKGEYLTLYGHRSAEYIHLLDEEPDPGGGFEVVTKTPLGTYSINNKKTMRSLSHSC